jgi:hypothetical protein
VTISSFSYPVTQNRPIRPCQPAKCPLVHSLQERHWVPVEKRRRSKGDAVVKGRRTRVFVLSRKRGFSERKDLKEGWRISSARIEKARKVCLKGIKRDIFSKNRI